MSRSERVSKHRAILGVLLVSLLLGIGLIGVGAGAAEGPLGASETIGTTATTGTTAMTGVTEATGTTEAGRTTETRRTTEAIEPNGPNGPLKTAETGVATYSVVSGAIGPRTTATTDDDADTIRLQNGLFMTDEPGSVGVTTRAEIPDRVTEFEVTLLSADGTVVDADGFEPAADAAPDESAWTWDGQTETPSLTYSMDANETVGADGPIATDGTYRFVDVGDWALVQAPRTSAAWSYTGQFSGQVRLERETVVDGEGAASRTMAFLGPHEERVHEGVDSRYRLIVPDAARPVATPADVFASFDGAAAALRVGAADDEVFAVVAPTGDAQWGVRGLQTGDADLWVSDEEAVDTPDDVWAHEYVHTRQSYRTEASARWFTEATATYYAALFALERGDVDFDAFERTLARGERSPAASSVLADPDTWADNADYTKGSLVAGELDRRIRLATDGGASLATVFRTLNDADDPITNDDVLDAVELAVAEGADATAAAEVRTEAERLTATRATPETWNRAAHAEAFGETPARVGYTLADEGVRASGEYRDRPVDRGPVELVAGETLDLSMLVSNTGGAAGRYELALTVDGEPVEVRSGTIDPGKETVERLERGFARAGEYDVRIGSETLTVAVTEPAPVLVRGLTTDPTAVAGGESVRATASVANDAAVPAGAEIEFLVDGDIVGAERVGLDANAETTVERDIRLSDDIGPGTVTVSVVGPVNEASTTVEVEGEGVIGGTTDGAVPGLGPVAAIVAVLTAGTVMARRRTG